MRAVTWSGSRMTAEQWSLEREPSQHTEGNLLKGDTESSNCRIQAEKGMECKRHANMASECCCDHDYHFICCPHLSILSDAALLYLFSCEPWFSIAELPLDFGRAPIIHNLDR